jgi:dihydroneopterin aldolase
MYVFTHWRLHLGMLIEIIDQGVEESTYETIEALATFIGRVACMSSLIGRVTVSVEKPKALIFVGGSGVEITRDREFYGLKR